LLPSEEETNKQTNFFEFGLYVKFYIVLVRSLWFNAMQDIDDLEVNPLFRALQVIISNQQSAISNADEQMQALSASISVSHY